MLTNNNLNSERIKSIITGSLHFSPLPPGTVYTLICNWPSPAILNVEPQKRESPPSKVLSETSLTAPVEEDAGDGGAGDVMLR